MGKRTTIVIAHRLTTIEKSDTILMLENGRLVEQGSFEELTKKQSGRFAMMALDLQTKE